jgi:beta-1,2-mannobiose phosphorylase / 1,2-beta-oligomannan phosphorylase
MTLANRFPENPILRPRDVRPSREDFVVECLLNPGAFEYDGRIGLLLRVTERPKQEKDWISTPVIDADSPDGVRIVRFRRDDPDLNLADPRVIKHRGQTYLTTLSHLRLAWSHDGRRFEVDSAPTLIGEPVQESFGIEDCRVTRIDQSYCLTYTAV